MGVGDAPAAAAFFDLDRTLIDGSSGIHFVRAAYRAGLVSRGRLARDLLINVRFRARGATDAEADAVRDRVGRMISGVPEVALRRLGHQILAGVLPNLYPAMLAIAHEHQDAGRRIYICTAASQEIGDLMALVLGFDGAIGSRSEVVDAIYTGRAGGPFAYGPGKAALVGSLAAAEGITLAESYAYSDSASDLPLLRSVGFPVAVNPDAELARVAAAEGWPVLRCARRPRRAAWVAAGVVGGVVAVLAGAGGFALGRRSAGGGRLRRAALVVGPAAGSNGKRRC